MVGVGVFLYQSAGKGHPDRIYRIQADFASILQAQAMFHEDHARYPVSLDELATPPPRSDGTTVRYLQVPPNDPWTGEHYIFHALPNGRLILTSLGADQEPGGEGYDADIHSSDRETQW